ncbi:divinyl protochlorophyllide a 8-vinyl-reductase [Yoonia sediminilitoris]|uniref:Divinyl protochlorophyllide a 8-vinyl-reductase n=2 Tax=Yoonia sediminilitoris TaxID=1286148 RepID=A0A2T6KMG7_9RHOB|nr:divinyl protochlorophyllide a 8-vinyl-reductase [Yoonia sediminilitoris]RCW97707.1 divinyl protochlorophyllide a 8-vinyl-reductase [Yoonia sediminilitoris]
MIPEADAARLHRQLRHEEPEMAPVLAAYAGFETANYILAHRIPKPAQWVLKALPKAAAASLLSQAIARHAWTFVGSGRLHVTDPWTFEIEDNPLIRGETSSQCLCDWHVGVFRQLYQTLVSSDCICAETRCGAQEKGNRCRFELSL